MTEEVKNINEEIVEEVAEEVIEEVVEEAAEEVAEEVAEEIAEEEVIEEEAEEAEEEIAEEEVIEEDEEIVEEKTADVEISLKDVADALEEKSAKTEELIDAKVSKDELNEVKADAEAQIKTLTEEVETLKAKSNRPSVISFKKEKEMENKDILSLFARKGIDGLKEKGSDLQISTDAQGGYALPTELAQEIIKLQHESSPMRQLVPSIQVSTTDYSQLVSVGKAASGWVGETDSRSQTNSPELNKVSAVFGEIYAAPKAYQHVLEDAFFNVEAWLTSEVAREFNEAEGVALLNGNGVNKPVGLLNGQAMTAAYTAGDATRDFGKLQTIKSGEAAVIGTTSDAIINKLRDMVLATKTGYLPNAKFMMNRNTHNELVNLKDSDGNYFLQRDITKAAADKIFGYDIVINEDMDDVAAGNFPILFGDFSASFCIVDRVGTSMLRDPYSAYGAVSFYTRKRVGSMIKNTEAVKVLGISA